MPNQLLRRVVIEYWLNEEPVTAQDYDTLREKLADCGKVETFEKIARSYCPQGVTVVVQ